jgi:hypothetical protein
MIQKFLEILGIVSMLLTVEVGAHSHRQRTKTEPAVTGNKCLKSTTTIQATRYRGP